MYRVWRKASYFRDYLLIMHPMQRSQRLSVRLTKQLNVNPCKTKCHNSINLILPLVAILQRLPVGGNQGRDQEILQHHGGFW